MRANQGPADYAPETHSAAPDAVASATPMTTDVAIRSTDGSTARGRRAKALPAADPRALREADNPAHCGHVSTLAIAAAFQPMRAHFSDRSFTAGNVGSHNIPRKGDVPSGWMGRGDPRLHVCLASSRLDLVWAGRRAGRCRR